MAVYSFLRFYSAQALGGIGDPLPSVWRGMIGGTEHQWLAGLFALGAAGFWLLSAAPWEPLPRMLQYWTYIPETDPFRQAMVFSAKMNGYAALCSCVAAILAAARLFIGR